MHSKHNFFDLSQPLSIFSAEGLVALYTREPYIEHFVIDKWLPTQDRHFVFGAEITPDWISSNLTSLDLFGGADNFVILKTEQLSRDCFDILSEAIDIGEHNVLCCFSAKSDYFSRLKKLQHWQCVTIDAPPFWKDGELLRFFCEYNQVVLTPAAINFILSAIAASIDEFSNLTKQLALIFPDHTVSLDDLQGIISPSKLDQFRLLAVLAQKNRIQFLQEVVALRPDYKTLEDMFRMVCSHFIKLADTSYMQTKKQLTKYDRQIEAHAKLWTLQDIEKVIDFFSKLQRMARAKDPTVLNCLREVLLLSLSVEGR